MKCFFIFALAAALAAVGGSTSWCQTNGAGVGGAGGAGAGAGATAPGTTAAGGINSNGVGNTNGTAGVAGVPGAAGTAGNVGTAGAAGNAGTPGPAGGVGTAGPATGVGPANVGNLNPNAAAQGNTRSNANATRRNANANGTANPNVNANGFNNGISRTPFFNDAGARRQLNMNDAQYNAMNRAYQDAYTRYNQEANKLATNPALTPEQRDLQLQQLQLQFNQQLTGTVNNTLTSPQMQSRYNQLNRQYMGYDAFNDPAVRQQLNLTPDQVRQLRTLSSNWRQQLQQFRSSGGKDLGSIDQSQWAQLQQQFATQLNGVLTPEQQQLWMQQTGQPYAFSPNVYFEGETASGNYGGTVQTPTPNQRPYVLRSPQNGQGTNVVPQGKPAPTANPVTPGTAQGSSGSTVR